MFAPRECCPAKSWYIYVCIYIHDDIYICIDWFGGPISIAIIHLLDHDFVKHKQMEDFIAPLATNDGCDQLEAEPEYIQNITLTQMPSSP